MGVSIEVYLQRSPKFRDALEVVRRLVEAGHQAFFAGGAVRDALLADIPHDFDVATSARPDEVERLFPRTEPVGKQFGVVLVVAESGPIEVATFRSDGPYRDGRRPVGVSFSSVREDAKRRDFTVNGLFYDPLAGVTHDYVGGVRDIKARKIRAIGDPGARFQEDKLRMLRAIRFTAQLNFSMERTTWEAIKANCGNLKVVSSERMTVELRKLVGSQRPDLGLWGLWLSGVFGLMFPKLDHQFRSPISRLRTSLRWLSLKELAASPLAFWAALLAGRAGDLVELTRPLNWSKRETSSLEQMLRGFDILTNIESDSKETFGVLNEAALGIDVLKLAFVCAPESRFAVVKHLTSYLHAIDRAGYLPAPLITGKELIAWGYAPGPQMGEWLDLCYQHQLLAKIKDPEKLKSWLAERCLEQPLA